VTFGPLFFFLSSWLTMKPGRHISHLPMIARLASPNSRASRL
jgi:hypothetical protein